MRPYLAARGNLFRLVDNGISIYAIIKIWKIWVLSSKLLT